MRLEELGAEADAHPHRQLPPTRRTPTSVTKTVTTPEEAAAGSADTHAESHNRHAPTSYIGGSGPGPRASVLLRRGAASPSGQMLMKTRTGQGLLALTCYLPVELPGIELGTEIGLTCGKTDIEYVKRRESTLDNLRKRGTC